MAYPGAARVRAITTYGMVMGMASVCGQLIGGILIQADLLGLGWRAVFLINVPVGLAALAFTPRQVAESRVTQPVSGGRAVSWVSRLDVPGLGHATPQTAGAVSGTMSAMQQVGNALGVALTGVIFFGAVHGGYGHAMELSLAELAGLLVAVAALTRLLPRPARRDRPARPGRS